MNHQDSVIDVPLDKLKKLRYVWDENIYTWVPARDLKVDSIKIGFWSSKQDSSVAKLAFTAPVTRKIFSFANAKTDALL